PLLGQQIADEEEASLALLYRGREALARGHLCSVVWKEVDPERPLPNGSLDSPAFEWVDAQLLGDADQAIFSWPDVRTEYIPCYPVKQAEPMPRDAKFRVSDIE